MAKWAIGKGGIRNFRINSSDFPPLLSSTVNPAFIALSLPSFHSLYPALFHDIVSTPTCYLPNLLSLSPLLIQVISLFPKHRSLPICRIFHSLSTRLKMPHHHSDSLILLPPVLPNTFVPVSHAPRPLNFTLSARRNFYRTFLRSAHRPYIFMHFESLVSSLTLPLIFRKSQVVTKGRDFSFRSPRST